MKPVLRNPSFAYNHAEILEGFVMNALSSLLTLNGNTQSDGSGTRISQPKIGERTIASTAQATPTYTQNGTIDTNLPANGITNRSKSA